LILSFVIAGIVTVVLLAFIWYLWRSARRLDRIHRRVIQTRNALDRALVKRASWVLRLADSLLCGQKGSEELRAAATAALEEQTGDDEELGENEEGLLVESRLTEVIRKVLSEDVQVSLDKDPFGKQLLEGTLASGYRVQVLRSLHNQDVTLAREIRSNLLTRVFHLAGHAKLPTYVDFDDEL